MNVKQQTFHVGDMGSNPIGDASTYEISRHELTPISPQSARCAACKGVAHPSTGCQYSGRTLICRNCTVRFWVWLRQHTNGKGRRRGPNFYDHVRPVDE